MANWTPNNTQAANSGSLQLWIDAENTNGYVAESSTTTDDVYGTANNISQINNLGTTGFNLTRAGTGYPTLRTGSLSGKNGFKFGNLASSWSNTVMESSDASITTIRDNDDRLVFSVMSNIFVDTRGATFKGVWGFGNFQSRNGFSVFVDTNSNRDSPVLSFTFSDHSAASTDLISDPPNKVIITAQNSSSISNNQTLFLNTEQIISTGVSLLTNVSAAESGFKLGSSNYSPDASDYVLHELLVYSVADSGTGADGFRNTVEGYLAHKWAITDLLPTDHPYKSSAPQIAGGGDAGNTVSDKGSKFNINPEGAPNGPIISRYSAVNTNYNKSNGTKQIPFTLQQPGPFSLKRRNIAYKLVSGDTNE
jgi:hypothetical protein